MIVQHPDTKRGPDSASNEPDDTLPPPYDASGTTLATPEDRDEPQPSSQPLPRPTNFVHKSKLNGSIKGRWIIDPAIVIPPPLLPPLRPGESEEYRNNLYLQTNNGKLVADVTLVPSSAHSSSSRQQFVILDAETRNGSVTLDLHDAPSESSITKRLLVRAKLTTANGSIYIRIPRSFRGVVSINCWCGSIKLSDEVSAQVHYSKEEPSGKRIWIGEFDREMDLQALSSSDELTAGTGRGNITVRYDDEEVTEEEKSEHGIISWLWNSVFFGFTTRSRLERFSS